MSAIGQRGKYAEKKVEALLKSYNERWADVTWHRYPDARSARGALKAQPCDYLVAAHGRAYHLEVKETEHEYRLPKDKISQIPVLRKFALAGLSFAVIVHHSTLKKWRCIPQTFFLDKEVPPSWDLREFPLLDSEEEALRATGWFAHP